MRGCVQDCRRVTLSHRLLKNAHPACNDAASTRAARSTATRRSGMMPRVRIHRRDYDNGMRILILGGYGLFGGRISRTLARDTGVTVIVAGRDRQRAERHVSTFEQARAEIETARIDTQSPQFAEQLAALRPDLVIDTAGPFQNRDYRVAEAALAAGAHIIDLADGRDFVRGIRALDERARIAGRWAISGASSVPGLTAAVVEAHLDRFSMLESVESAIAPGNRTPRGWATTLAILGYTGHPFRLLRDGAWRSAHGWQSLRRLKVDGVSARWLARCEVPDLDVLPARYPTLRTVDFRAGLELRRMHFGLWLGSWCVRAGLLDTLTRCARPLFAMSEYWQHIGSDTGFIRMTLRGRDHDNEPHALQWTMIARNGDGPQIPATAAVVLARKLARGELPGCGAQPCIDLFTLEEFLAALEGFSMETRMEIARDR
jgi:Saccharopine dehydrogenase NADP binding domain